MPRPAAPPSETHRIAKLLARAGVASRREVERMITEGRVALNGMVIDTPATILPSLDGVTVDGNPVAAPEAARLFLYHKPSGLLVTERDPGGRPTIYDRLPKGLPRVVPVGRLDLNTEGLLLLTTDGGLKRQLELPATGVERAYRARAYGQVSQTQLEDLIEGVEIDGVRYGSIDANIERRTGANVWIELVLTEGKNREVRRVLEHLGLKVSRLIRTRYGPFVLGDLPVGGVGEVRAHDIDSFRKNPTRLDLPQPPRVRADARPGFRQAAKAVAEPERPASRPTKPTRGKPAKGPRVRADGTVAKPATNARTRRAKAFRDASPAHHGEGERSTAPSNRPRRSSGKPRAPSRSGSSDNGPPRRPGGRPKK